MKINSPRIDWTEKPNGSIVSWQTGSTAYHQLISYTTPICTAIVRQGYATKWYKHTPTDPKVRSLARSRTTMTHFNQFVKWMGAEKGSIVLDDLPEAEVV